VDWDKELLPYLEGLPLKNITVKIGDKTIAGELLLTRYGLEGGAIYQLGRYLRANINPIISIDFKPTFTSRELSVKIASSGQDSWTSYEKAWRLSPAASVLLKRAVSWVSTPTPLSVAELAKNYPIPLKGPRPIAEAISSAGGISCGELDEFLMIKRLPGLFVAGEMIDWEAPTGGYLLQGCFTTATRAAKGVVTYLGSEITA
jgi:predicted flavoprotein YhiN